MTDQSPTPPGRFTLTRQRLLLLAFGALALLYIIGAMLGGVGNYQQLREAAQGASSASGPAPAASASASSP